MNIAVPLNGSMQKPDDPKHDFYKTTCFVCGEEAKTGQRHGMHYHGRVCLSCKGFFSRCNASSKQHPAAFVCTFEGPCIITPNNRRSCQKCRYEKCLESGMDPLAVLTDDQKRIRFRRLIQKSKQKSEVTFWHFLLSFMSPGSLVFYTVEPVRIVLNSQWWTVFYLGTGKKAGELLPDRSTEPFPLKQRAAALGMLGSCSQVFCYIYTRVSQPGVLEPQGVCKKFQGLHDNSRGANWFVLLKKPNLSVMLSVIWDSKAVPIV